MNKRFPVLLALAGMLVLSACGTGNTPQPTATTAPAAEPTPIESARSHHHQRSPRAAPTHLAACGTRVAVMEVSPWPIAPGHGDTLLS